MTCSRKILFILIGLLLLPLHTAQAQDSIRDRIKQRFAGNGAPKIPGLSAGVGEGSETVPAPSPEQNLAIAGQDVAVWGSGSAGIKPLIVFSHGFKGCNTQSRFLLGALADAGYLVMAPNHADAACVGKKTGRPEEPFREDSAWTPETYKSRHDDIVTLLDALKAAPEWKSRIDWDHVGLAGHSLGGYTVLGLAGAWASWKIPGIKAVLALSPYCAPYLDKGTLGKLGVPVMYQGGTLDMGITPTLMKPDGAYDQTAAPAYFFEFRGAGHFAWTDRTEGLHAEINHASLWFFNKYLMNSQDEAPVKNQNIVQLRTK